jgi:hypothetical protein
MARKFAEHWAQLMPAPLSGPASVGVVLQTVAPPPAQQLEDYYVEGEVLVDPFEVMMGLNKLSLPGFDIQIVKDFTRRALDAIRTGKIGYAIIAAAKLG